MQCPNLRPSSVQRRIAMICRAFFSRSDAANVSKVGVFQRYGGTFAGLMNSKTKISQRDALTAGIRTSSSASRLSRFITGNFHLSSEWSWTKKSCENSDWTKRLRVKNKMARISKRPKKWRDRITKSCPRARGECLGLLSLSESISPCCPTFR